MKRTLSLVALALFAITTIATAQDEIHVATPPRDSPFVRVVNERFFVDGAAFRFVGANAAIMHGSAHRAAFESTLDAMADDGLRVARIWALGERDAGAPDWARSYAFRIGPDGWVEDSYVHLDRVLAHARDRNLRVVLVLANRWADYGGIPQYLRWSGDPFDADVTDGIARTELGTFFGSTAAQQAYLAHVDRLVSRINTVTGVAYRDDPTIFAWELVNEISAERRAAPALASWVAATARHIRAVDPNHLVSAGHIGYTTAAERRTWREIVALPEIDFADAHAYPTEHDRVHTQRDLDAFVDDHARLAHGVLHKPLVFGEVGFSRARRALGRSRAQLFDRFFSRADRDGVDGVLVWTYAPSTDGAGAHTILADVPDADSRRVREVLRARAEQMQIAITSPDWPTPDAPIWTPSRDVVGTPRAASPSRTGEIVIAPSAFAEASFESVGAYDGFAIAQIYGGGYGHVSYRFRAPRSVGTTLRLSMRASSELPGRGTGATAGDGSHVLVSVDGCAIGAIDVPPDDAIGHQVSLEVPIDEALAAALHESRIHTLRFEIADDDSAHGLCLYGDATGAEPLAPEIAAELPGRISLVFLP